MIYHSTHSDDYLWRLSLRGKHTNGRNKKRCYEFSMVGTIRDEFSNATDRNYSKKKHQMSLKDSALKTYKKEV